MTTDQLYKKHPFLFERSELDKNLTCFRGIECDDGWIDLIDQLSTKLTELYPTIQYEQIKEKFGLLRIYLHGTNDSNWKEIRNIVNYYEELSLTICETCGESDDELVERKLINHWYKTICTKCEGIQNEA